MHRNAHPRCARRQVYNWTGIEREALANILTSLAGYYLVGGLGPWSPTFSPENLLVGSACLDLCLLGHVPALPHNALRPRPHATLSSPPTHAIQHTCHPPTCHGHPKVSPQQAP